MHRLAWLLIPLALAACGGKKPVTTLTVTCEGGTQLFGAESLTVQGDTTSGRPTITYPDPTDPGKTGTITVQPGGRCKVAPQTTNG